MKKWLKCLFSKLSFAAKKPYQVYEENILPEDNKVMVFQNENEVERFKIEQEIRELQTRIDKINETLIPWEKEQKRKHRELWNY